jgi:lysophospholipase L1-like esterase
MLGDSFTMGKGVEDDQTFSVLVERFVNEQSPGCQKVEILNGGVDSYAPILELLYLERDLQPLAADMVVLNLDVSDLVQEAAYRTQAVRGPDGEIVGVPQHAQPDSLMERIRIWTERHLFFTRVVLLYANRALGYREITVREVVTRANAETVAHTLTGDVDRTEQWHDLFESLTKMKAYTEEHGMEFLLTVYPWAHEISDTEWVPGRYAFMPPDAKASHTRMGTIEELSAANEIPLLDVTPAFRNYRGTESLYFKYDMHWTTTGHQVMAKAIADYLRQRHAAQWCD